MVNELNYLEVMVEVYLIKSLRINIILTLSLLVATFVVCWITLANS